MRAEKKTGIVEDGKVRAEIAERFFLRILHFSFPQITRLWYFKKPRPTRRAIYGQRPRGMVSAGRL
jgi:hypothetical protein